MIKILEVICIRQFQCGKKEFLHGKRYKAYQKDGKYLVYNEGMSFPFYPSIPGKLRLEKEQYFNYYFMEEKTTDVKNKAELKAYLENKKEDLDWTYFEAIKTNQEQ